MTVFGFFWEQVLGPAIAAAVAGGLLILGNWLQNRETRRRSTTQHIEQTVLLETLASGLTQVATDVAHNRVIAETGHARLSSEMSELKGQIKGVIDSSNVMFNMIAEVDSKVTKGQRKKATIGTGVPSE